MGRYLIWHWSVPLKQRRRFRFPIQHCHELGGHAGAILKGPWTTLSSSGASQPQTIGKVFRDPGWRGVRQQIPATPHGFWGGRGARMNVRASCQTWPGGARHKSYWTNWRDKSARAGREVNNHPDQTPMLRWFFVFGGIASACFQNQLFVVLKGNESILRDFDFRVWNVTRKLDWGHQRL